MTVCIPKLVFESLDTFVYMVWKLELPSFLRLCTECVGTLLCSMDHHDCGQTNKKVSRNGLSEEWQVVWLCWCERLVTADKELRKSSASLVGDLIGRTPPATRCSLIPRPSEADPSPLPEQLPCQTAPATDVPLLSVSPASTVPISLSRNPLFI